MTTQLSDTQNAYVHSDEEAFPAGDTTASISSGESDQEPRDPDGLDTSLLDAEDFVFEQNRGALHASLYGPSATSTKVSAVLTHAGKLVRIEEEGAGYLHPSFDALYFDCEADPAYHHSHPGTLTIHGCGLDCWDYVEETKHGLAILRRGYVDVTPTPLPGASVKQLLRRVDDLKKRREAQFGLYGESQDYFAEEDTDLRQLIGDEAMAGIVSSSKDIHGSAVALLNVLNRGDVFADLTKKPCISQEWNTVNPEGALGMWTFIWQMIITTELARRLATGEAKGGSSKFSRPVLASLIIADKWMSNAEPRMTEGLPLPDPREVSPEEKAQTEELFALAEEAMDDEDPEPELAVQCLGVAIALDPANVNYRQARCRALVMAAEEAAEVGNEEAVTRLFAEGVVDARRLTQYTPNEWTAWAFLAKAQLGRGAIKKSLQAWEQALTVAEAAEESGEIHKIIRENIAASRMGLAEEFLEMAGISDPAERHRGMNEIKEWDFEILGNVMKWWSNVHAQQEEGLVKFAESIEWPYVDEVRGRIIGIFERMFAMQEQGVFPSLHDWLYGLLLPGNWFADSIMTSLVSCTASLSNIGFSSSDRPGLILPRVTYWRTSTVLGRVLGALPGAKSVNGWVGPCPPVQIDLDFEGEPQMLWVDVGGTPRVPPNFQRVPFHDPVAYNEDVDKDAATYATEITDPSKWTIPIPPVRDERQYILKSIQLRHTKENETSFESEDLKCDADLEFVVTQPAHEETSRRKILARKLFSHEPSSKTHTVPLRTSPAFVVPPRCDASDAAGHSVHAREAGEYQMQTWAPNELVDDEKFARAELGGLIVINATGEGAETMARALCALRGLNAVIRISQGPCYKCAVKATKGLKMGALIWCN
ncbi:hypothetical protein BJX68DRAFT_278699 [Aspergillus pseudodeflectus]|uniref:Uncharacterized protein n=1 Tax=Aspergillus pseudodeflectus TaxID=176178 RepID=A0ABR4JNE6_9EURO